MSRLRGGFALVALAVGLGAALALSGCSTVKDPWADKSGPPRVVVSFPPLVSFVKNVGGEHVGIINLCTATGPHHYDPKTNDFIALQKADLFVINGLNLDEKFADRLKANSGNRKLVYLNLGAGLKKKGLVVPMEEHEGEAKEEKKDEPHEHEDDPHVWLGIPQACAMVELIRDELVQLDAAHADEYKKNAAKYVAELKALQKEYKEKFAKKANRKIVSSHDALGYFADSFGLKIVDVIEKKPGETPEVAQVKELVEACRKHKPAVITTEPQYPSTSAEDLLNELRKIKMENVKLVQVDPLETTDSADEVKLDDPAWYVKKMRQNLDALLKALP
jgi:zinc transport system substrate-binding protein